MSVRRDGWLRALGTVAIGAGVALGAGAGVAAAEPDASTGDASGSSQSQPAASDSETAESVAGQRNATSTGKIAVKPTSTLRAATVTIEHATGPEPEATVPANPVESAPIESTARVDPAPVESTARVDPAPPKTSRRTDSAMVAAPSVEPRAAVVTERAAVIATNVDARPERPKTVSTPAATTGPAEAPTVRREVPSTSAADVTESRPTADTVSSIALLPAMAPPPQTNIVNVIGTVLFTLLTLPLKLFEQTPVLPAGYAVTVGRSTLDTGCGCGQSVDVRWYFPDQAAHDGSAPRSLVYLQHGFLRSNSAVSAMAIELAERTNSVVVTPTLTSNFFAADGCTINGEPMQRAVANLFVGDRTALTQSALAAGWTSGPLPTDFVLAGHSAGGGLAAAAAGYTVDNGAVSDLLLVLMLDGVPSGDALPTALGKLVGDDARQVLQIASPPYAWNANGLGVDQLTAARPGQFVGVQLVGGSHVDYEGASSDILARLACGFSRPENVAAAQNLAVGWIDDAIARTVITAPGGAGQTVTLPTDSGPATAVVLGGAQFAGTTPGPVANRG